MLCTDTMEIQIPVYVGKEQFVIRYVFKASLNKFDIFRSDPLQLVLATLIPGKSDTQCAALVSHQIRPSEITKSRTPTAHSLLECHNLCVGFFRSGGLGAN